MKLVWSSLSKEHLGEIFEYVALDNEIIARNLVLCILDVSETVLGTYPDSGRVGRVKNTLELVISKTPYVIAYKVQKNTVFIIAVWHSSRKWPEKF